MRVLAYRIQATAFGDLDTAILRRLREHRDASFESARPFAARGPTTRGGVGLKSVGVVALPGYVCRDEVRSGALRRVLPTWLAGYSTITALIPNRQGLLPSVRVFIDHLAAEFPKAVRM